MHWIHLAWMLLASLIRFFIIKWDTFLQLWDERFHALVAKNLVKHPLLPTLVEPTLLSYDFTNWTGNYVWLHKQPFMLWGMAAAVSVFGTEAWVIRLPGLLASVALIPVLLRMGTLLERPLAGQLAAFLWTFSWYAMELNAGVLPLGQNDVLFTVLVTCSSWTFLEWTNRPSWKWTILTGLFIGLAVLTKWLTGILVLGGWGLFVLLSVQHRTTLRSYLQMLAAVTVASMIVLPWQLYIFQQFPQEAAYEMAYNSNHLFEPVEFHAGSWDFYFAHMDMYLGDGLWIFLVIGIAIVLVQDSSRKAWISLLAMVLVVWVFFSFVAQTKMVSYVAVTLPLLLLLIGACMDDLWQKLLPRLPVAWRMPFGIVWLALLAFHTARPAMIYRLHELDQPNRFITEVASRPVQKHNVAIFEQLDSLLQPNDILIVHSKHLMISARYFSNRHVYDCCPDKQELQRMKDRGYRIFYTMHPWIHTIYGNEDLSSPTNIDIRPLP